MDAFFRAKEEAKNRAAATKVKPEEEGRSSGKARGSESGEFLQIYLQLQADREEREEARAAKESSEAHERNLQFMQLMAAIMWPPAAGSAAPQ
eukprot:2736546-Rhodomonas_salina.1